MVKHFLAAFVSAGLLVAPLPMTSSYAQETKAAQPKATKKRAAGGQTAARERQKKCGAEWREAKKAGTVAKNATWPKFWSECNKRLKAQST